MNKKKTIIVLVSILLSLLTGVYVYAACSSSPAYTKGDCDFGQVCAGGECKWADRDFDGFPNYDYCVKFPDGSNNCDCDDYDPEVHPGAIERCNYKDDNCDGIEVVIDMDTCKLHDSDWQAYYFYMMAYMADCGLRDAVYNGHACEAGDGVYTDYGNYIYFVCPPAGGHQANMWLWKCCGYNVTETGEGIDEGDACQKTVHICDEDPFLDDECDGKTWCKDEDATRDEGECEYTAEGEYLGVNEFNVYSCHEGDCYKFVKGTFQICGYGWECTAICFPGECNPEKREWCDNDGIWKTEGWCHSNCGRADLDCGGNCEPGACDLNAQKVCNENGYWVEENYCDCDVCGTKDSSCDTWCTCEEDFCDIENEEYCDEGAWSGYAYCLFSTGKCCEEDYNCQAMKYVCDCKDSSCDTTNNLHCSGGAWSSDNYCSEERCELYDYDCGSEPCEDKKCDIINKTYCDNGIWTNPGASYCFPGYCGTQDPTCECSNVKDDCCLGEDDEQCDFDCLVNSDPDCLVCSSNQDDCCDDTQEGDCDLDCVPKLDPDCQTDCDGGSDGCCKGLNDLNCDPDCTINSDPNCCEPEDTDPSCEVFCTTGRGDCCVPDNDGVCDPDCITGVDPDCAAHPCDEDWNCSGGWDEPCTGVNDEHTCFRWEDLNGCNTYFYKPKETQKCYKEFTCEPDDDSDGDGYPERACYDAIKEEVLDEIDCDDNDASQNPEGEEICNGEDDNCDGSKDEGCPCVGGATQPCGKNEGTCRSGIQVCEAGYWGVCGGPGYIGPKKEKCDDGLDNNCDGYMDENCNCIEGEKQDCGTDEGICEKGWQACYNGSFGSVCNDVIEGTGEVCDNNLDDDCDSYIDGDDSSCQVETPVTEAPASCGNNKQDGDEQGIDCGGSCPTPCKEKPSACDYGKIEEKCTCGKAAYRTGYCCNGKYSVVKCVESPKDSDDDGCNDDKEAQLGTDPLSGDTDGDGLLDCSIDEIEPLCNEDGICDSEREYPETLQNCPSDCGEKGLGFLIWILLAIVILALVGVGGYFYAKKKGYKLSDFIKIKGKKKEEKPAVQYGFPRGMQKKPLPAKPEKPVAEKPTITAKPRKMDMLHLRAFVRTSLRKGYTKLQVRKSAIEAGWPKERVDEALRGKKSKYKLFK